MPAMLMITCSAENGLHDKASHSMQHSMRAASTGCFRSFLSFVSTATADI